MSSIQPSFSLIPTTFPSQSNPQPSINTPYPKDQVQPYIPTKSLNDPLWVLMGQED